VLRARKAQEGVAQAAAARARAEERAAAETIKERRRVLADRDLPGDQTATAFAAAIWARQALAGALNDSLGLARTAETVTRQRVEDLAAAAVRRRALEQLAERHAEAQRQAEELAERAVLDELAGTAFHRGRNHDH
jgi:hypothetical protein